MLWMVCSAMPRPARHTPKKTKPGSLQVIISILLSCKLRTAWGLNYFAILVVGVSFLRTNILAIL
jgi:hypothetical protein